MRFLTDENVPRVVVVALEAAGHDVAWVAAVDPSASDTNVLARAIRENRILLTFDKDFSELAAATVLPSSCGVVLLRLPAPKSEDAGRGLAQRIGLRDDWAGHFSVIEPARVRMRRLR